MSQHRDSPQNELARHYPDIDIVELGVLVQVKNGKRSGTWPNVIAELASWQACVKLHELGRKVWLVWEMPDGQFQGNEIHKLRCAGTISPDARRRGSGTPAVKIAKSNLVSLDELLNSPQQAESNLDGLPMFAPTPAPDLAE